MANWQDIGGAEVCALAAGCLPAQPSSSRKRRRLRHFIVSGSAKKLARHPDEYNMTTTMPFGKYRGKPISEVFRRDPKYLAWFCDCVDGNDVVKRAIRALPGLCLPNSPPQVSKPVQEVDLPNLGVDPGLSREQLDRLCWEILHPAK
jgi:hypothetical protein